MHINNPITGMVSQAKVIAEFDAAQFASLTRILEILFKTFKLTHASINNSAISMTVPYSHATLHVDLRARIGDSVNLNLHLDSETVRKLKGVRSKQKVAIYEGHTPNSYGAFTGNVMFDVQCSPYANQYVSPPAIDSIMGAPVKVENPTTLKAYIRKAANVSADIYRGQLEAVSVYGQGSSFFFNPGMVRLLNGVTPCLSRISMAWFKLIEDGQTLSIGNAGDNLYLISSVKVDLDTFLTIYEMLI